MTEIQIGNQYQSSQPLDVTIWLAVGAPVTLMGRDVLPAGEAFVVTDMNVYGKVCCLPVNYEALHEHFVSQQERGKVNRAYYNQYEGYALLIDANIILDQCQLL